ncbi:hypothetical protein SAMN05216480_10696 [Pustulibacterium marinum]|uniref:Uncharacterized protein n=1 Tax=Pustulibacterium marinum TaxID=1224947 RepID=A0A1I7GYH8_9FLAO|nr:hypothetical protein [Pustulibacterium marinum]SFU53455.1 hypothetical protein SAMN05216480_10696 [Pustulibacterium marinum]
MAKNQGIIRLRGSIDGVTYSEGQNGRTSRSRSNLDKDKMEGNSNFDYIRLLQQELSLYSKYGALLRSGVKLELNRVKATRGVQRLNKILNQVKNLDTTSPLGSRNVTNGLSGNAGKALLHGFDFYGRSSVYDVFETPFAIDEATGVLTITDLVPADAVIKPSAATHLQFRLVVMNLDGPELLEEHSSSNSVYLPFDDTTTTVTLTPTSLPTGGQTRFYVLQILFYLEVNGFKQLIGADSAALTIVQVE